jgi:hypothetical protein
MLPVGVFTKIDGLAIEKTMHSTAAIEVAPHYMAARVDRNELGTSGAVEGHIDRPKDAAAEWSAHLRSEAEASAALKALVDPAELHHNGIRLSIRMPIRTSGNPAANGASHLSLTRQIPLRVRRRGIEMRLVIVET